MRSIYQIWDGAKCYPKAGKLYKKSQSNCLENARTNITMNSLDKVSSIFIKYFSPVCLSFRKFLQDVVYFFDMG